MGLEKRVYGTLLLAGIDPDRFRFECGLKLTDPADAEEILGILNGSGDFGPATCDASGAVSFGIHPIHLKPAAPPDPCGWCGSTLGNDPPEVTGDWPRCRNCGGS